MVEMLTQHEDLLQQARTAKRRGTGLATFIGQLGDAQEAAVKHIDPDDLRELIKHLEHRMFCPYCANIHLGPCFPDKPLNLDAIVPV